MIRLCEYATKQAKCAIHRCAAKETRAAHNHEIHVRQHSFCMLVVGKIIPTMLTFCILECFVSWPSAGTGVADMWRTYQPCSPVVEVGMAFTSTIRHSNGTWPVMCDFERDVREQNCHSWLGPGREVVVFCILATSCNTCERGTLMDGRADYLEIFLQNTC